MLLSKGIVDAHGGKLWLTSEGLGTGCTFGLGLPLSKGQSFPANLGSHDFDLSNQGSKTFGVSSDSRLDVSRERRNSDSSVESCMKKIRPENLSPPHFTGSISAVDLNTVGSTVTGNISGSGSGGGNVGGSGSGVPVSPTSNFSPNYSSTSPNLSPNHSSSSKFSPNSANFSSNPPTFSGKFPASFSSSFMQRDHPADVASESFRKIIVAALDEVDALPRIHCERSAGCPSGSNSPMQYQNRDITR